MQAVASLSGTPFAADVAEGLSAGDKWIASRYLYDEVGTALFQTLKFLPEYGICAAEERLLKRHAPELSSLLEGIFFAGDFGSGTSHARRLIANNLLRQGDYSDIDVALNPSYPELLDRATCALSERPDGMQLLITLLGGSAGLMDRASLLSFLKDLRNLLQPGDYLLFSADLVKDAAKAVGEYNDPAGISAAFNRNLLCRINCDLGGKFNPKCFDHVVRWNAFLKRVELHLVSSVDQEVYISGLSRRFSFRAGESILTECFYKFSELELETLARSAGFQPVKTWTDLEWAFAEVLWMA